MGMMDRFKRARDGGIKKMKRFEKCKYEKDGRLDEWRD